jgi:hypothetical protein
MSMFLSCTNNFANDIWFVPYDDIFVWNLFVFEWYIGQSYPPWDTESHVLSICSVNEDNLSITCTLRIFLNEKQKSAFICHSISARFHRIFDVAIHQTLLTFQHDIWWSSLTCSFSISTVFLVKKINTATVDKISMMTTWVYRTQIIHFAL